MQHHKRFSDCAATLKGDQIRVKVVLLQHYGHLAARSTSAITQGVGILPPQRAIGGNTPNLGLKLAASVLITSPVKNGGITAASSPRDPSEGRKGGCQRQIVDSDASLLP